MTDDPPALDDTQLTAPEHAMNKVLSLYPVTRIDVPAAAALAGLTEGEAALTLTGLTRKGALRHAYLVHDPGLWHIRDATNMDKQEKEAAARLVEHLLQIGAAAQQAIIPGRWYLGPHLTQPPAATFDEAGALAWMETQLPVLTAVQMLAHDLALHTEVWEIAELTWGLFSRRKRYPHWAAIYRLGLHAANIIGEPTAKARMRIGLAQLHLELDEPHHAEEEAQIAYKLAVEAGHRLGKASALETLGLAALATGRIAEASKRFVDARKIHKDLGRPRGVALMKRHEGEVALAAGRLGEAHELFDEAVNYFSVVAPEPYQNGRCLLFLARVHIAEEDLLGAELALATVLEISQDAGTIREEARARRLLARVADLQGASRLAHEHRGIATGLEAALNQERRAIAGATDY